MPQHRRKQAFRPKQCAVCCAHFTPDGGTAKYCGLKCRLAAFTGPPTSNGCREWTGLRQRGYGTVTIKHMPYRVHRLAWEQAHGPIPGGKVVRHKCDNPACLAVDHLELGSVADNIRDALERGQIPVGEKHPLARLTNASVREIRARLQDKEPLAQIARRFDVSVSSIRSIRDGLSWRWIK